jgi:hypothetical protein
MARRRIVILGGVGSGVIVADAIRAVAAGGAEIELVGFLNDVASPTSPCMSMPRTTASSRTCTSR